jgi:hypothetical protein
MYLKWPDIPEKWAKLSKLGFHKRNTNSRGADRREKSISRWSYSLFASCESYIIWKYKAVIFQKLVQHNLHSHKHQGQRSVSQSLDSALFTAVSSEVLENIFVDFKSDLLNQTDWGHTSGHWYFSQQPFAKWFSTKILAHSYRQGSYQSHPCDTEDGNQGLMIARQTLEQAFSSHSFFGVSFLSLLVITEPNWG